MNQTELNQFIQDEYFSIEADEKCPFGPNVRRRILFNLLSDRLANYGYSNTDWRRIQQQRRRAKQALVTAITRGQRLHWYELSSRWCKVTGDYTVGQSSNEEYTNSMRALLGLESWVS